MPSEALVTAEGENRLIAVELPSGRVVQRVRMPADPEFVSADSQVAVVVSPGAGAVSILDATSLRSIKVLHNFSSPHIAEVTPDRHYAYVSDDEAGELAVIHLADGRLVDRIPVGAGAHHLAISPDGRRVWVALGESAHTIAIVGASHPANLRVVGSFDPGFAVHDLQFTPDGRRVWLTAASSDEVAVVSARDHDLLFRISAGAPPQHVVFEDRRAYVSSGYGSQVEAIDSTNGHVLAVSKAPYGSFNLDARDGFVAASSLLRGTVAIYDDRLRLKRTVRLAPAARDVAIPAR